jgi:hypothetical protein
VPLQTPLQHSKGRVHALCGGRHAAHRPFSQCVLQQSVSPWQLSVPAAQSRHRLPSSIEHVRPGQHVAALAVHDPLSVVHAPAGGPHAPLLHAPPQQSAATLHAAPLK